MEGVSHAWPAAFEPLLEALAPRPDHADCWFADVDLSDEQLRLLNCFEGSARHGRVWFKLPRTKELVAGEMNPLLGTGGSAADAGDRVRVRISFHDVRPNPQSR